MNEPRFTLEDRIRKAEEHLTLQRDCYYALRQEAQEAQAAGESGKFQHRTGKANAQFVELIRAEEVVERLWTRGHWVDRHRDWRDRLLEEYADRGPQYEMLIERACAAEVRAEQLTEVGRAVEAAEWRASSKAVLETVQALQRYTESEKQEVIIEREKRAMLVVLAIAERVVAAEQPALWEAVLAAVERQLPAGTEVAS